MKAITGRDVFYHHEFVCLMTAQNIEYAYQSSQRAANWAEWSQSYPKLAKILTEAAKLHEGENGTD